jgi:GxxExxY protein
MSRFEKLETVAASVVDCGFHIHREIGPGLLESAYEALMAAALEQAGHKVMRQVPIAMNYRGVVVDNAFKIDLLVDDCLIVELKSVDRLAAVHGKQLLTYLRLSKMPLGLLMNFGQATFKDGLKRVANEYYSEKFKL